MDSETVEISRISRHRGQMTHGKPCKSHMEGHGSDTWQAMCHFACNVKLCINTNRKCSYMKEGEVGKDKRNGGKERKGKKMKENERRKMRKKEKEERERKECRAVSRPELRRTWNYTTRGRFPPTPIILRL